MHIPLILEFKRRALTALLTGFVLLTGCNDKPDVQPADFAVYPNPAIDMAAISVVNPGTHAFSLKAFDTKGVLLLEKKVDPGRQTFMLELSGKPKGKYQVVLKTDKQVSSVNLIKL